MSNILEGITSDTTVSLGFLVALLAASTAVLSFLFNAIRRGTVANTKSIASLTEDVRTMSTTMGLKLQAIETRLDGGVSAKELMRWIQTLQRDNKSLVVPVMEFTDGQTEF